MLRQNSTLLHLLVKDNFNFDNKYKPMLKKVYWSSIALCFIVITSCTSEMRQQLQPVPTAFGPRNQLVIVADTDIWESAVGDSVRYYFSSAYLLLPQPEPIYDLLHYTPEQLNALEQRKQLRSYLFLADLNNEDSPSTKLTKSILGEEKINRIKEDPEVARNTVGVDRWAKGQLLVFIHDLGEKNLADQVVNSFPAIKKRIDKANEPRIDASIYVNGQNNIIQTDMEEVARVRMRIPKQFFVAVNKDNTLWIRRETPVSSSNIMIYKMPYRNQSQLTRENLKFIQDSLGRKLVSSEIEGTYMQINDVGLPMLTQVVDLNGNYALEARGIWEIVNDYMGGAFVSYLTVNPKSNDLLFINGFVHAPGEEKREFMQDLEYIIHTIEFL